MSQRLGYALSRTILYTGYAYSGGYAAQNQWWFNVDFDDATLTPQP